MNSDGTALGQAAFLPSRFARFLFCFAGDGVPDVPFPVIPSQCVHWRGNPLSPASLCEGGVSAKR